MRIDNIVFRHYEDNDAEIIYKAYLDGSFTKLPDMNKEQFYVYLQRLIARYSEFLVVECNSKSIAFVAARFDGWKYEPHVETFRCASKRELFNGFVEFFDRLSKIDTIGVIVVKALEQSVTIFDHVCKRNVLQYIGKIPSGDYRGDEYIYSAKGNAKFPTKTKKPTVGKL